MLKFQRVGHLGVTIQTNGTSQVGTHQFLACQAGLSPTAPIGAVTYEWTSTCSGDCFVLSQSTAATVSTQYLKAVDSGTHTCTVTDSVGNQGSANVEISTSGENLKASNSLCVCMYLSIIYLCVWEARSGVWGYVHVCV
jgi:hypothetical protein